MKKVISTLVLTLLAVCAFADGKVHKDINFHMPEESVNGSFVIRVNYQNNVETKLGLMELWRSYDNGQFLLVSRQPQFDAISQMLYRPGSYSYFIKVVQKDQNGAIQDIATSDVQTIDVKARHSNLISRVQ